ncbi:PHP domain-containing protein [Pectinatus sottacetonis]|uniref:PHP domain-containing protein n=1 Tax=Pectinatus sottacetonis TaxID=1002795 RepID=UPI0018C697A1|nr:PHP domain-containing protein [Pectinatus sottacetonis]
MMDLHCHTLASDGQYTPTQLVYAAKKAGISVLSITDHDTIDALEEGVQAAKQLNILFIPGIEINARGKNIHILGYNINYKSIITHKICKHNKYLRQKRAALILTFLKQYGINLNWSDIDKYAQHKVYARPHFARAMLDRKYVSSTKEAFDKYLDNSEFHKIKDPHPTVKDAVKMIKKMQGIPVLAHPMRQGKTFAELNTFIDILKKAGLAGLECYHSENTIQDTELSLSLAHKHSLLITGGSDFHGEKIKPKIKLGTGINKNLNFNDENLIQKILLTKH